MFDPACLNTFNQSVWLLSGNIAVQLCILVILICIIVLLKHQRTYTFNRLTLLPYYYLIGYSFFAIAQFVISPYHCDGYSRLTQLVNQNKVNFLNFAVAFQAYEWFNTCLVINFQTKYDITTVGIEKRKFQPLEKALRNIFYAVLILYSLGSNIAVCFFKDDELFLDKNIVMFSFIVFLWLLLVPCLLLFPWLAHSHFRFEYKAYRKAFFIQMAGTIVLMLDNTQITGSSIINENTNEGFSESFFIKPGYLEKLLL